MEPPSSTSPFRRMRLGSFKRLSGWEVAFLGEGGCWLPRKWCRQRVRGRLRSYCWNGDGAARPGQVLRLGVRRGRRKDPPWDELESESEEEENANYLNESSGEEWDSSEEEDPVVPNLTPLESLAWQALAKLVYKIIPAD
ncbi:hypothetical protein Cadr_000002217 [Camelus dromedarius]|uniref:Uncharacterized protein n=1 Tax=Camelus dromedarius TaxID=9838 RepID=A0A5N4EGZ0_CAMDR|nr:hypothetical protein Cadr_000002217 [Camelus dromedarius]